jgi:hypothetical protein
MSIFISTWLIVFGNWALSIPRMIQQKSTLSYSITFDQSFELLKRRYICFASLTWISRGSHRSGRKTAGQIRHIDGILRVTLVGVQYIASDSRASRISQSDRTEYPGLRVRSQMAKLDNDRSHINLAVFCTVCVWPIQSETSRPKMAWVIEGYFGCRDRRGIALSVRSKKMFIPIKDRPLRMTSNMMLEQSSLVIG